MCGSFNKATITTKKDHIHVISTTIILNSGTKTFLITGNAAKAQTYTLEYFKTAHHWKNLKNIEKKNRVHNSVHNSHIFTYCIVYYL
jgi:hypothetical protein